jgi:stress-induced morphogen
MIAQDDLAKLIRTRIPDAHVEVFDLTGTLDHYRVRVSSKAFATQSLLDRHRLVEESVRPARSDGRLHALEIRTEVLE